MHAISVKVTGLVAVAALAAAGLVAVATSTAHAASTPCQRTYASSPAMPITDHSFPVAAPPIDVPEDGLVVSDIDITVNVTHPDVSQLVITTSSDTDTDDPRASGFLFNKFDPGGDNLVGTTFDDAAATAISSGTAPFTGRFRPVQPLSDLNGFAGGKYGLAVQDTVAGSTGTLDSWSITLRYRSCDFDGDGAEDHADACLGVAAHTATGCPLTTRAVTASYRTGKFKGVLSSPVAGCKAARPVTVWKVRSGPDKVIGTKTTRADGRYKLTRAKKKGKYYATSPRVVVAGVAECPAVKSPRFRIR